VSGFSRTLELAFPALESRTWEMVSGLGDIGSPPEGGTTAGSLASQPTPADLDDLTQRGKSCMPLWVVRDGCAP
jgi:hypothetical protein